MRAQLYKILKSAHGLSRQCLVSRHRTRSANDSNYVGRAHVAYCLLIRASRVKTQESPTSRAASVVTKTRPDTKMSDVFMSFVHEHRLIGSVCFADPLRHAHGHVLVGE